MKIQQKPKLTKSKGYSMTNRKTSPTWDRLESAQGRKLVQSSGIMTPGDVIFPLPDKSVTKTPSEVPIKFDLDENVRKEIEDHIVNR